MEVIRTNLELTKLAALPGILQLTAIDDNNGGLAFSVQIRQMLLDTGAHISIITDDMLDDEFRHYLIDPIHDEYRSLDGTTVQYRWMLY